MTANELIENFFEEQYRDSLLDGSIVDYQDDIKTLMLQFAKLHVEAALKAASENAETTFDSANNIMIDKESILNSYPLTNVI